MEIGREMGMEMGIERGMEIGREIGMGMTMTIKAIGETACGRWGGVVESSLSVLASDEE